MHNWPAEQEVAYERAVIAARNRPDLSKVIADAFLQADGDAALSAFRRSEHAARALRWLRKTDTRPGASVLDFGGGRGILAAFLSERGFNVTLCEPNPSDVCGAGAARGLVRLSNEFRIHRGPVADLFGERFDVVVCRAVLHHVEPLVPTLEHVRHALNPGRPFIALDEPTVRRSADEPAARAKHPFVQFGVDERAYPPVHYRRALRAAGFHRVSSHFPVSFGDYRKRPGLVGAGIDVVAHARFRVRDTVLHPPGAVRVFVGWNPPR